MKNLYDVFDEVETLTDNCNENTVYVDTGADIERIKNGVREELGIGRQTNKKTDIRKKFAVSIAAAVLAVCIGTTVIAANGGLHFVFGDFFGGNGSAGELYQGSDVQLLEKDDNINVKVLGIAGDESRTYIALEISRNDGQPFTGNEYTEYHSGSLVNSNAPNIEDKFDCGIFYDYAEGDIRFPSFSIYHIPNEDKTKIKIIFSTDCLKDKTVTIISKSFQALKPVRVLASGFETHDSDAYERAEKIRKENHIEDGKAGFVKNGETYNYCEIAEDTFNLNFKLSMKLDYQINEKQIIVNKDDLPDLIHSDQDGTMKISPFGITLQYESKYDLLEQEVFDEKSKIILKDGSFYYLHMSGGSDSMLNQNTYEITQNLTYVSSPALENICEINLINIDDISEIIINNNIVYSVG